MWTNLFLKAAQPTFLISSATGLSHRPICKPATCWGNGTTPVGLDQGLATTALSLVTCVSSLIGTGHTHSFTYSTRGAPIIYIWHGRGTHDLHTAGSCFPTAASWLVSPLQGIVLPAKPEIFTLCPFIEKGLILGLDKSSRQYACWVSQVRQPLQIQEGQGVILTGGNFKALK